MSRPLPTEIFPPPPPSFHGTSFYGYLMMPQGFFFLCGKSDFTLDKLHGQVTDELKGGRDQPSTFCVWFFLSSIPWSSKGGRARSCMRQSQFDHLGVNRSSLDRLDRVEEKKDARFFSPHQRICSWFFFISPLHALFKIRRERPFPVFHWMYVATTGPLYLSNVGQWQRQIWFVMYRFLFNALSLSLFETLPGLCLWSLLLISRPHEHNNVYRKKLGF